MLIDKKLEALASKLAQGGKLTGAEQRQVVAALIAERPQLTWGTTERTLMQKLRVHLGVFRAALSRSGSPQQARAAVENIQALCEEYLNA